MRLEKRPLPALKVPLVTKRHARLVGTSSEAGLLSDDPLPGLELLLGEVSLGASRFFRANDWATEAVLLRRATERVDAVHNKSHVFLFIEVHGLEKVRCRDAVRRSRR